MNEALLELLADAQQAQDLAHQTHLSLYKKMVEVNPLTAKLLSTLTTLEKIGKELS